MVKFKDFSRPLSVFQVLFKANLIFKDFSRQSCIFMYFSSLWEPCSMPVHCKFKSHVITNVCEWLVIRRASDFLTFVTCYEIRFWLKKKANLSQVIKMYLFGFPLTSLITFSKMKFPNFHGHRKKKRLAYKSVGNPKM